MSRKRLLFVSPRFLFPADSGGLIRTTQVLRGMKGGAFDITLVSPGSPLLAESFSTELNSVADHWKYWQQPTKGRFASLTRLRYIFSSEPIPVATDRSVAGNELVARELAKKPDVVVFDFPHSAVLAPDRIDVPAVIFTHNVEAEIFRRHIDAVRNLFLKQLWRNQTRKMEAFERKTLVRFETVIAVSRRDCEMFEADYGVVDGRVISTGVDLEYFEYQAPAKNGCVLFLGSMDWLANVDAMNWLMDEIWPLIAASQPGVRMKIVGRSPPETLVNRAKARGLNWEFTGFVDDVREHVRDVSVFVIPLRVGGGTRIKVYEAIAMGMPVVSTTIGVEGLPLIPGEHYLCADEADSFAEATLQLLVQHKQGEQMSAHAISYVSEHFSSQRVAREFEAICLETAVRRRNE